LTQQFYSHFTELFQNFPSVNQFFPIPAVRISFTSYFEGDSKVTFYPAPNTLQLASVLALTFRLVLT